MFTTEKVFDQIGGFLGTLVKLDDCITGGAWQRFYRLRVLVSTKAPIRRFMKMHRRDGSVFQVSFKYERLNSYCYYCGFLDHAVKFCLLAVRAKARPEDCAYGTNLRTGSLWQPMLVGAPWLVKDDPSIIVERQKWLARIRETVGRGVLGG